jgi:hypothetical protein
MLLAIQPWEDGARGKREPALWGFKRPAAGWIWRLERGVGVLFIGGYAFLGGI